MSKRQEFSNHPFAQLRSRRLPSLKDDELPKPDLPSDSALPEDEGELFRQAVGEVTPVRGQPRVTASAAPSQPPIFDADSEAYDELCTWVESSGPIDLSDTDEFIEGGVPGIDRRTLKRLRAGDYAIQAHVDLHGMTRDEAKAGLIRFVETSRRKGYRLVLVVHGRGLHSKDQIPVLKESMRVWLSRGRVGRHVLAFTTARRCDGGLGAVYVLLRK